MINVPSHFKVVNLIWDLHMMCCIVMVFILSISILIFCYSNLQWKCTRRFCAGCHISSWPIRSLQTIKEFTVWHQQRRFLKIVKEFFRSSIFSDLKSHLREDKRQKHPEKLCLQVYLCRCVQLVLRLMTLLCEGCGLFEVFSNQSQLLGFTSPGWHHWTGSLDPVCEYDPFDSKRKANAEPNLKALK